LAEYDLKSIYSDPPAIVGGKPVRESLLPFNEPWIDEEDLQQVEAVLESGKLAAGYKVRELEERFSSEVGVRYAMAVVTGTAALHAACYAAGISRGEEVITTPLAFSGFANAPLYLGAKLIFADVNEYDLNISPEEIERNVTESTCAVVASHFAGHPCDLESISAIARRHNLAVVEDATSALGASYRGKPVGSFATAAAFSFHPEATITAGAGGMVTTDDEETYRWLKLFCNQGIVRERARLVNAKEGPWHYEVQELGFEYRPTEIQAALALSQLEKLPSFLKRRRKIAARYNEAFRRLPMVEIPHQDPDTEEAWNLYVLRLNPECLRADRKHIFLALQAEGVEVGVHYLPVYLHPLHGWLGDPNVCTLEQEPPCPKAEQIYGRLITLPLYPRMTDADVQDVISAVHKVLAFYSL
jgi:dTDP-4-amino-4,6-dideoxygalactose transaminase